MPHALRAVPVALAGFLLPTLALAQEWDFTVDQSVSGVTGGVGINATTSGTLMGNYDPDTNPGGTRTRVTGNPFAAPGPTQNDAVPASAGFGVNLNLDTSTSGLFNLTLSGSDVMLSGLTLDLLSGGPVSTPVTASIAFSSFTTANPGFFYPGIPLDLPLGEVSLDQLVAQQTGGALLGSATPDGMGGFDVSLLVPVEVSGAASFAGQSLPIAPIPAFVPVMGQLTTGPGSAFFMGSAGLEFMQGIAPDIELPAFPLSLPTLGGSTADVELALTLDSLDLDLDLTVGFGADGVEVPAPGAVMVLVAGICGVRRRRSA